MNIFKGGTLGVVFATTVLLSGTVLSTTPVKAATNPELGILMDGTYGTTAPIQNLENTLGIRFQAAKWYMDWNENLDTSVPNAFHAHSLIPEMTWQPQINGTGVAYNAVTNGSYDAYITGVANQVRGLGYTVRISLAPEMNGDWSPWGVYQSGNSPAGFISFYRYVVQKFRDVGTNNVEWIWAPNVHYGGESYSFASMYPGDAYVAYTGLDGYNWGTTQSWSTWQSFREVFQPSYNDLTALSGKQILIMETASTEVGGNKAQWITDMFASLRTVFPQIKGFTWFNLNKETDWRITSSTAAQTAFANAVKGITSPTPTPTPVPTPTPTPVATPKPTTKPVGGGKVTATPTATQEPATSTPQATSTATATPVATAIATPKANGKVNNAARSVSLGLVGGTLDQDQRELELALMLLGEAVLVAWFFARNHAVQPTNEIESPVAAAAA